MCRIGKTIETAGLWLPRVGGVEGVGSDHLMGTRIVFGVKKLSWSLKSHEFQTPSLDDSTLPGDFRPE